jgi:hypothetical protein
MGYSLNCRFVFLDTIARLGPLLQSCRISANNAGALACDECIENELRARRGEPPLPEPMDSSDSAPTDQHDEAGPEGAGSESADTTGSAAPDDSHVGKHAEL